MRLKFRGVYPVIGCEVNDMCFAGGCAAFFFGMGGVLVGYAMGLLVSMNGTDPKGDLFVLKMVFQMLVCIGMLLFGGAAMLRQLHKVRRNIHRQCPDPETLS